MSGEKTEAPTPKKLRDAREEGQVAHSKDLTQAVLVVALFGYLIVQGPELMRVLGEMMLLPAGVLGMQFEQAVNAITSQLLREAIAMVAPLLLIVLGLGIGLEMAQTGMLFAFKGLAKFGKKLNVVANVKNMFSVKNLVEFLKSCLKIVLLSGIVFWVIKSSMHGLMTLPQAGVVGVGVALGAMLKSLLLQFAFGFGVIAFADFFWQRYQHRKQLMMSKHEIHQEYKQSEGDPHIKGERKHLHMEMLNEPAVGRAREATVLVTNPVHVAIALVYQKDQTPLPIVTGMGREVLARRMVHAAKMAGVPVIENVVLAWSLLEKAQVDAYIPEDLVEPVAEVLRWVQAASQDPLEGRL